MSMSHDMVKSYVKTQLAKAVSAGILKGVTESTAGHTHRYAVMYDEHNKMFVGETDFDGVGPHTHYIMMGLNEVTETHIGKDPQPRTEEDVVAFVDVANAPANMRRIIEFYNLKEIRMVSHAAGPDGHVHALVVRFAGHNMDKMGRKAEAKSSIFDGMENIDQEIENIKQAKLDAKNVLEEKLMEEMLKYSKKPSPKIEASEETVEENKKPEIDFAKMKEDMLKDAKNRKMKAEDELNARIKEHMDARKNKRDY